MSNLIEGLTALNESEQKSVFSGGQFALPASFDSSKFASKWVEEGPNVQESQQEQVLAFAGVKAQGWAIHKVATVGAKLEDGKTAMPKLEPYKRAVGRKVFVLLQRPLELQKAVNRIYANQSRTMVNNEVDGETKTANPTDPGVLTNADIRKFDRQFQDAENSGGYLKGVGDLHPDQAVEIKLA